MLREKSYEPRLILLLCSMLHTYSVFRSWVASTIKELSVERTEGHIPTGWLSKNVHTEYGVRRTL